MDKDLNKTPVIYVQQPVTKKDDEIDLDFVHLFKIFKEYKLGMAKASLGMASIFLLVSFALPKTYESTAVVQISNDLPSKMSLIGGGGGLGTNTVADNYIALMKSRKVVDPIVENLEYKDSFFSTAEENKAHALADSSKWAEKNIALENIVGTNLIKITATSKKPEQAQEICQAVVDNFLTMQTELNKEHQSLLLKFLEERIKEAREESVEAGRRFSEYQKNNGIYSPNEQGKMAVSRMDAYVNTLTDLKARQEAKRAELSTVSEQLAGLNENSRIYQINDNEIIKNVRQQIVDKEVSLVNLRSKYTDENPEVERVASELQALKGNLSKEVEAVIASQTASMSPQQSTLIGKKMNAEVEIKVAIASEEAINKKYKEEQKKLDDYPEKVRNYMDLQQEATMAQGIYTNLVNQAESAKIQAAKDSMDIQVVDQANMPLEDMPASPRKGRNALVGFFLGILLSLGKLLYVYVKERKQEMQAKE